MTSQRKFDACRATGAVKAGQKSPESAGDKGFSEPHEQSQLGSTSCNTSSHNSAPNSVPPPNDRLGLSSPRVQTPPTGDTCTDQKWRCRSLCFRVARDPGAIGQSTCPTWRLNGQVDCGTLARLWGVIRPDAGTPGKSAPCAFCGKLASIQLRRRNSVGLGETPTTKSPATQTNMLFCATMALRLRGLPRRSVG